MSETQLREEFDRQVQNLLQKDYPEMAGMTVDEFVAHVEPLKERLSGLDVAEAEDGRIPFVIVVKSEVVAADKAMESVERQNKKGLTVIDPDDIRGFTPIEGIELPEGMAYLLVDIDTGKATLNVTPDNAMGMILNDNRSSITIDEGIAVVTHYPESVRKNNGFSLLASRCGDRRVTALWISQNRPKLGWCWAGNPHTWLGSASCRTRIGASS